MNFGFLFDNDGVLIDSRELHWKAWQLLMKEDINFYITFDEFLLNFGRRVEDFLKDQFPNVSIEQRSSWDRKQNSIFNQLVQVEGIGLLPGMEDFLLLAKKHFVPMIIASSASKENLELFFEKSKLGIFFDKFVCAADVKRGKPDPEVFQIAAGKLDLDPENCIVFEDALVGLQAASLAGCTTVALETTQSKDSLGYYDLIYSSPEKLNFDEIIKFHSYKLEKSNKIRS